MATEMNLRNRVVLFVVAVFVTMWLTGCGGSSMSLSASSPKPSRGGYGAQMAPGASDKAASRGDEDGVFEEQELLREAPSRGSASPPPEPQRNARGPAPVAPPPPPPKPPSTNNDAKPDSNATGPTKASPQPNQSDPASATQATRRIPMLIYTADIGIVVVREEIALDQIEKLAAEMGGFLASRNAEVIVIRVPKDRFFDAVRAIDQMGEVIRKNVSSRDVTDEYLDLELRLKNARVMRDRLQELLAKATNVTDSLAIERELQRITDQIERMEGRLKLLRDQLAFSTLTISVKARTVESLSKNPVKLPFAWMSTLGLGHLLELHE